MAERRKKLLLLGGSPQQVVALRTAGRLGYTTVLCDWLKDNPGRQAADRFYPVSTTDREGVLRVARQEGVDGVLAYASDPAAPTAAYVAERLGLPGNSLAAVETLCDKEKFRAFLRREGFSVPGARAFDSWDAMAAELSGFRFPVIVKPVDSSGSKGVSVAGNPGEAAAAYRLADSFSKSRRVIVEEFVTMKHPWLVGGDIFVRDGRVILWGLMNCHRDPGGNPLVPVGKSYPLKLSGPDEAAVRKTLQRVVTLLGIRSGPMNVEAVMDSAGAVYPIDMGPRSGGNMIPDLLSRVFGVDLVEMAVQAAAGGPLPESVPRGRPWYATHVLHAGREGRFRGIRLSEELRPHVFEQHLYKQPGDRVEPFENASGALGILLMRFDSEARMHGVLERIHSLYAVELNGDPSG